MSEDLEFGDDDASKDVDFDNGGENVDFDDGGEDVNFDDGGEGVNFDNRPLYLLSLFLSSMPRSRWRLQW